MPGCIRFHISLSSSNPNQSNFSFKLATKRNMAAAVDSLTKNLQSVNEPIEGHSISYRKRNRAAELASLQENFECVNAALEGLAISDPMRNMAETIPSSTENFQSVSEALENAKKHLFLKVQIFDDKIDKQRELSDLIMREFDKVTHHFSYLKKMYGIREFKNAGSPPGLLPSSVNLGLQVSSHEDLQTVDPLEKQRELFFENVRRITGKTAGVEKKQDSSNEDLQRIDPLEKQRELFFQNVRNITGKTAGVEKKQVEALSIEDLKIVDDSFEEAKKPFSQRLRDLERRMGVLEKRQEYIFAGKSHSDSFADQ